MPGRARVKWLHVRNYWSRRAQEGFNIHFSGGDAMLTGPGAGEYAGHTPVHRVGHHFCNHAGNELPDGHLNAIKRKFGVTREQLIHDRTDSTR